eukprot:2622646-Rhodomonas_salina.1
MPNPFASLNEDDDSGEEVPAEETKTQGKPAAPAAKKDAPKGSIPRVRLAISAALTSIVPLPRCCQGRCQACCCCCWRFGGRRPWRGQVRRAASTSAICETDNGVLCRPRAERGERGDRRGDRGDRRGGRGGGERGDRRG